MLEDLKEKLENFLGTSSSRAYEEVECTRCDRQMYFRDVFEHFFTQHLDLEEEKNSIEVTGRKKNEVRLRDLVDDYSIDREVEKEKVELQRPTGGGACIDKEVLEARWRDLLKRLESGKVCIGRSQHFGSYRGHDIARRFEKVSKRLGLQVEVEYKDREAIIRKV